MRCTAKLKNTYAFECFDREGLLKWREVVDNLVTTAGLTRPRDCDARPMVVRGRNS